MSEVILPELGEGIKSAIIALWHFNEGDQVKSDDDIVELVTDKASFNVSAGNQGIIKKILYDEGQEAKVGEPLAIIE